MDGEISVGEVQKLAYFLQAAGGPLRLNYEAGHYGLELLSSVYWIAHRGGPKHDQPATTPDEAYRQISQWNRRKENLFTREHVEVAWECLGGMGWMNRVDQTNQHE